MKRYFLIKRKEMKILQAGNGWILSKCQSLIEECRKNTSNLRPHAFIVMTEGEGGMLMNNTITGEAILFEPGDDILDEHMISNLWLVPDEFDETEYAIKIRQLLFDSRRDTIMPRGYTIVTTTGCNARCFYCYEKGIKKNNMTEKTASDLADYIIKNYEKYSDENRPEVALSWFGGEPLYNKAVISIICSKLREANVKYRSSMISNGYFFDDDTVAEARQLWNLRSVQITLDGTESVYNKAKNYVDKSKSPFQVVTDNIDRLSKAGIRVSIRVNVGYYNKEDIKDLVKWLSERFSGRKNITVYFHALFDNGGITDIDTEEKEKEVYETMAMLEDQVAKNGMSSERGLGSGPKGSHCMADNGSHLTVQADGRFSLCEHYVDTYQVGGLYEDGFDEGIIKKFKEISEPFDTCYRCPLFPECSYLVMCEDNETSCGQYRQEYKIQKKIRALKILERRKKLEVKTKSLEERTNGHRYVDMGLPSRTLWAVRNVKSDSDWGTGEYFQWGKTVGEKEYTQENYSLDEKYISKKIRNLEPVDDVARAEMGGEWHLPTLEQCRELVQNTTFAWTSYNGVKGAMLTSKINKKFIFFPSTGYFDGDKPVFTEDGFCLWTSTHDADSNTAWFFNGNNENVGVGKSEKWKGMAARGVLS